MTIRFGSVCSGIEAASVAWHPLGWRAAWLAEIEPFPSAVLKHHYPDVPNYGDMTQLPDRIANGEVEAPDLFCGGTPCQAFSVAGLRKSLDDSRGNLSLVFCEIANAIDNVRRAGGKHPATVFWENVPGVLNTKDNAFGCFLAGLAGEADPLVAPGGKWPNAGVVYGPERTVAWRVLDAQYFGVAQRRRRVFVVASAREKFDPAEVLFEFDGVRRDSAPSREAGQSVARGVEVGPSGGRWPAEVAGPLYAAYGDKWGSRDDFEKHAASLYPGHPVAFGGNRTSGSIEITPALLAQPGSGWKGDFESETFLVQPTHTLRGEGFDASEDGTGRGTPLVPVTGVKYAHYSHDYAHDRITDPAGVNPALTKEAHASGNLNVAVPVAYSIMPMNSGKDYKAREVEVAQPLMAGGPVGGNQGGDFIAQPVAFHPTQDPISSTDVCHSIGANANATAAVAHVETMPTLRAGAPVGGPGHGARSGDSKDEYIVPVTTMQVRRLTPVECERLQGFPDNYTAISWRKKPASECPDGPRYKALGNSWAVPNVRWIGTRIHNAIASLEALREAA